MPPQLPHHLLTVWNPSYQVDALEAHAALLRARAQAAATPEEWDDVYVWWGKVKSPNRLNPWARAADVHALTAVRAAGGAPETHLYLTDYRSLYVGDLAAISFEDQAELDPTHVPAYYRKERLHCEAWFCLADIRRLVHDDSLGVIQELAQLRNIHYHDKPVSLYGGMVDLPLVVTRQDGRTWFEQSETDALADGKPWVVYDAMSGGVGAMEQDLRDNLLGEQAWNGLDPRSRTFVATAEKIFRDHRSDAAFDFGPVITNLAKALEVETNARLREGLKGAPKAACLANIDGQTVDVTTRYLSLGQLAHAIGGERALNQTLTDSLQSGGWFAGQLPPILDQFREVRNPAAHSGQTNRATAREWRNRILGVGGEGLLVQMAKVVRKTR